MKWLAVALSLVLAACSSNTIDPVKNPEVYKVRKALTLPKDVCVKYQNKRTQCK